jgi:hypothetical protein
MGTRSAIGVMHGDKVKAVYCHWDGYLAHNGKILQEHYNSAKANHLVALGGMSSLRKNIEIPEGVEHSFDKPQDDITVFYGRDRGETGNEFQVCFTDTELFEKFDWCEYFYVMKDGVWYVSEGTDSGWKVLADAIAEEETGTPISNESNFIKFLTNNLQSEV